MRIEHKMKSMGVLWWRGRKMSVEVTVEVLVVELEVVHAVAVLERFDFSAAAVAAAHYYHHLDLV